jgi:hypothetical protein
VPDVLVPITLSILVAERTPETLSIELKPFFCSLRVYNLEVSPGLVPTIVVPAGASRVLLRLRVDPLVNLIVAKGVFLIGVAEVAVADI